MALLPPDVSPRPAATPPGATAFEAERELLARSWTSVARVEDVAEPGQFVSVEVAGEPVVVVRDRAGVLRAFANVCRHRSTTLVEGCGRAKALQCPHHLWTYSLEGRLVGAPGMAEVAGFSLDAHSLPVVAVETWQGWVFVNLDPAAPPLAPDVRGLDAVCEQYGVASMRRAARVHLPSPWNWKVSVENFLESYHHAGTHPRSLQPWTPGERSRVELGGDQPWVSLDHESLDEREPFTVHVAFPHHMFSIARPHVMTWFNLRPRAADAVDLTVEVFLPPDLAEQQALGDAVAQAVVAVNEEDIEMNRRTAQGRRSRYAVAGPLHPLEDGVRAFRSWMASRLQEAGA